FACASPLFLGRVWAVVGSSYAIAGTLAPGASVPLQAIKGGPKRRIRQPDAVAGNWPSCRNGRLAMFRASPLSGLLVRIRGPDFRPRIDLGGRARSATGGVAVGVVDLLVFLLLGVASRRGLPLGGRHGQCRQREKKGHQDGHGSHGRL